MANIKKERARQTYALPILSALSLAIFLLWPTVYLLPLKLLTVFFHEASHALMTLATGGQVEQLVVDSRQGGYVISRGGNRPLILSAGYLGSMGWGALLYWLSVKSHWDKWIMMLLGIMLLAMTMTFVKDLYSLIFVGISGVLMIAVAIKAKRWVNDLLLRMIGLTSLLYAPLDIYSDIIQRPYLPSDAAMLAQELGGFTLVWGLLWLIVSLIFLWRLLSWVHR